RVGKIDRPGVAVTAGVDDLAVGLAHLAEDPLDIGERADIERQLLHHWLFEIAITAAHQYYLVMVAGIAAEERDATVGRAVADDKPEHASVKVDHLGHIADIEPDMAQAWRLVLRHRHSSVKCEINR